MNYLLDYIKIQDLSILSKGMPKVKNRSASSLLTNFQLSGDQRILDNLTHNHARPARNLCFHD